MANFDDVNSNSRRYLSTRSGSACSLVLFGLVPVITGLGETGIFLPVWEQIVRKMMVVMKMT